MIFELTCKNCKVSENNREYISHHLARLRRTLPAFEQDMIVLRLVIHHNTDKYHPPRIKSRTNKDYSDTKTALANFEGSIALRLNKNRLYTSFKGQTIEECLEIGFKRIFEQIDKHKEKHFSSNSRYPYRSTIRGI